MADTVFATLTPANTLPDAARSALRIVVEPQPKYYRQVFLLVLQLARRHDFEEDSAAGDASETVPEPESEIEEDFNERGMVWEGRFLLASQPRPASAHLGLTVGKRGVGDGPEHADLLLCTKSFDKKHRLNLRSFHARFNFAPHTRGFSIALSSRQPTAQLAVDGVRVSRSLHLLNKHRMAISFGKLEYEFKYTPFASSQEFEALRDKAMKDMGALDHVGVVIPTPLATNARTIGPWTVGKPLGRGGHGTVFMGTNANHDVVALKVMDSTDKNRVVANEVEINTVLSDLAEKEDTEGRILRQREVIYGEYDIVSVHWPVVPMTLDNLVRNRGKGGPMGKSEEAAGVFRDALLGVKFLHDRGWMHRDLKPTNIGVVGRLLRCVLLDIGTAEFLGDKNGSVPPTPGDGGTITYLAPERELLPYNHSVDIWALGIVGYELTYGCHPFKFLVNPWRVGEVHEKLRPQFERKYGEAMDRLANDGKKAHQSPTPGYIHLGSLLIKMLRHPWAQGNCEPRVNIDDVLSDPAWKGFLDEVVESKRARLN